VWWIYNTVPNRAGFESGYGSEAGYGFFFFMQMLFWIMILRNRFFFDFSLLNIFGTQSSEPLKKKSNLLHVWVAVCMCSHFFSLRGIVLQKCGRDINCSLDYSSSWVKNSIISPTKIEQHFGGLWNFETPLMLLSLSQKVVHSMIDEKFVFLQIYSEFVWYVCSLKFILHFT
jgi:hypothetical protein